MTISLSELFLEDATILWGAFLERERANLTRIHENRSEYYSVYVGEWFETYPEVQFKEYFRFTKATFQVYRYCILLNYSLTY